eukprot:Nitzschia sp. Nitz4//scaffold28_size193895//34984//36783//NITZ4_001632-RA/size193895-processed-gene-0.215-mRNA-1//1//CDS//3329545883//7836//frame0
MNHDEIMESYQRASHSLRSLSSAHSNLDFVNDDEDEDSKGVPNYPASLSDWEEGLGVIESILELDSPVRYTLTKRQIHGLVKVRKILLQGGSAAMHIPRGLLINQESELDVSDRNASMTLPEPDDRYHRSPTLSAPQSTASMKTSSYLLSQFGGWQGEAKQRVKTVVHANRFISRLQMSISDRPGRWGRMIHSEGPLKTSPSNSIGSESEADVTLLHRMPEWDALDESTQTQLATMLSWDQLRQWDFDIFKLAQLTKGQPLLFMGWAILASPHSQYVMQGRTTLPSSRSNEELEGYEFLETFDIPQDCLLEFLRTMERDYIATNPYHNNTHAADVLQTFHAILEGMDGKALLNIGEVTTTTELETLALLLAAVIHDVGHPGRNNNFQVQAQMDCAIAYNDVSVLENMHAASAFSRLMGSGANPEVNIFQNMPQDQIATVRKLMVQAVLHTDMTKHFGTVNRVKGIRLLSPEGADESVVAGAHWELLYYCLHLADISNQAKTLEISKMWTDRCLDEFFEQGDEEKRLGLPVSPLCDRDTTQRADSQVGFIEYVVSPAFQVLASFLPEVETTVLPILEANLAYWKGEQDRELELWDTKDNS